MHLAWASIAEAMRAGLPWRFAAQRGHGVDAGLVGRGGAIRCTWGFCRTVLGAERVPWLVGGAVGGQGGLQGGQAEDRRRAVGCMAAGPMVGPALWVLRQPAVRGAVGS